MDQVCDLVVRAASAATRGERIEAYGRLVERFRDMACAYGYSILGDFHLAEDAAQEAFIVAFEKLRQLQQPDAFSGWFRRIVWSACGEMTRRKSVSTVHLEAAAVLPSAEGDPVTNVEQKEMRDEVLRAIRELPEPQREVTALFYINGYSQNDIADFLEVPVGTVKNRLHASRGRLKERMLNMVKDTLHENAPDESFDKTVIAELLARPRPLEIQEHPIRQMWDMFRHCASEFTLVELAEVCDRSISMLSPETMRNYVYEIDSSRILRPELTSQLFHEWIARGGGACRFVTVGRIFRKGHKPETATSLEVHHQAEILWVDKGLTQENYHQTIRRFSTALLPGIECRPEAGCSYAEVPDGCWYVAPWQGESLRYAAGGAVAPDWIAKGGLSSKEYGGVSFAFGLERTAQIRFALDDIRKLWQPPFVT